jgi:hypothetical protein
LNPEPSFYKENPNLFCPKAPKDKTKSWIKTDPGKGFFVVFRFYGLLEGYIEKTWKLNDFKMVELGG